MIKEIIMYQVQCDNCKEFFQDDYCCAWTDPDSAVDYAIDSVWIEQDSKHYCNDCYLWSDDETDEIILNKERRKD